MRLSLEGLEERLNLSSLVPFASPTITTTQQPASAPVGSSIADQATVTGLANAGSGDTITFNLYSSSTTQDSTTLLFTDTETVTLSNGGATASATSKSFTPTAAGTDFWVATFNGDTNNGSITSGPADEPVTITGTTPTISTTQQPASATVGTNIADQASISGLLNASSSDTVTFNLYSSSTTQDSTTLLFTDTETVTLGNNGTTATATSANYMPTTAGTDFWVATFNGDTNNGTATSGASDEPVTITPTTPTIATTAQPTSATVGTSIQDQATVTGLVNANSSDTVTFNLYDNPNGTGTALFTDTETVTLGSNGTTATAATPTGFTTTTTGTNYWVATFNGDTNNNTVTSGVSDEPVTVTPTTPTIATTQQPTSGTVGTSIADTATVTGLVNANSSDTVTFNLYDNASGTGTALFTDIEKVTLSNNGTTATATSAGYTPTATGTDFWVATFSGDSNNNTVTSGVSDEPVTVTPTTPTIATTQQPASGTVGSAIKDQATVTGLVNANSSDTVTFNLYSSATTQDSTTLLFTDTEAVTLGNNGTTATAATPTGFTTTTTGTNFWVATFNGDTNNNSVTSGASDEPVTVTPTTPTIATTQQPASAPIGGSLADTANVTGLVNANSSDTVTFNLYSSATTQDSTTLLFTDTEAVTLGSGGTTATATSKSFTPTAAGTDFWVATFNGDTNNGTATSGASDEPVTVTKTTPTISTTQQPASATVGTSIADKASVSGLTNASSSDTVTFNLYSSSTTQDSTTLLFTDTEAVTLGSGGTTATATSKSFTTTAAGTDFWVATFNGDTNNGTATSGASDESVIVSTLPTPTISTTQQPASATVGSPLTDTATVSGLTNASSSDTVTFNLYSSATTQNSTTLLFTDTETVTLGSNGTTATATSKSFTTTAAGTDYWVAKFNGDTNNNVAISGASDEPVIVSTLPTPTITTTQQPTSATVGSPIADKASISGLTNAGSSDTVTFNLYSSATTQNSTTLLFTDTETVTLGSNGTTATATSKSFTTTAPGTDFWVAKFNGDTNNNIAISGANAEPVTVTKTTPSIATTQQPTSAPVGGSINDTASVTGLVNANSSDTVTFNLYSSATTQDSTTLLFTDTETVTLGSGGTTATATSKSFTPTVAGTDFWVATFNGDSNNNTAISGASDESVTINQFNTNVSLTTVKVVPSLTSQSAQVTLTAHVSNPSNTVNEGFVSFTMGSATAQANVVNGTASVQLTVPLSQILGMPTVSIAFTDNAASPSFTNSNSSTKLYFNPWSALLPSTVSFASDGTQFIQIQAGSQDLLAFAYSMIGLLTQINVTSTTYPVTYSHIGNDVLASIGGMPWQLALYNANGQYLGLLSVALAQDGSAEIISYNAEGQIIGISPM